jgi:uncharacterized protein YjbI with pentapeptide repeats
MNTRFPSRQILDNGRDVLLTHFSACSENKVQGWWLDLQNEDLSDRDFSGWTFVRTIFDGANLNRTNFSEAAFYCCSFFRADAQECNFQKALVTSTTRLGRKLPFGNLMLATNLVKSTFQSANLTGTYLAGSDLSGADLRDADLSAVKFGLSPKETDELSALINKSLTQASNDFDWPEYASEILSGRHFDDETSALDYLSNRMRKSWDLLYSTLTPASPIIEVASSISSELLSYLKSHPKELYNLRPRQFEELVAEILGSFGWEIELTPATKDGGYDIFAVSKDVSGLRSHWIIECKKYAAQNKVGVEIVRQLYGVKSDLKVANALLATTSTFTKGAQEFKASRYDLELRDYNGILEWVQSYRSTAPK